jgi:hypothetical protein
MITKKMRAVRRDSRAAGSTMSPSESHRLHRRDRWEER